MKERSDVILPARDASHSEAGGEGAERPIGSRDSIASPRLTWLRSRMTRLINPYIVFILIWILFSFPFFFQGRIPAPLDFLVNFFAPWDKYFDSPVKNPAISDVVNQIIPWKTFTAWSLLRGEIPLWNPYNLAGSPHLANWQSGVLYPTNLFFLFLPFTTAWSFHILLQPLLAGLFMILYLKSLSSTKGRSPEGRLSPHSCLLGALAFSYGGFMTTWLEWGTLGHALVWLPLGLYGVEQGRRSSTSLSLKPLQSLNDLRGHSSLRDSVSKSSDPNGEKEEGKRNYWWIAIIFSWVMSLFAGHLQISLYVIATIVAYLYFRTNHQWSFLKFSLTTFYLLLATLLLAFPQLLPSFHLYQHAYRSESLDEEWFKNFRVPLYGLATFIAPDFFGNPVTRNHWSDHSYVEMMGYVGVVPLLFALFAALKRSDPNEGQDQILVSVRKRSDPGVRLGRTLKSVRNFFIGVIITSFLFSLQAPLANLLLWLKVPVLSSSSPARIIGLITFSLSVLAAIGVDEFMELIKKKMWRPVIFPPFLVSIFFLILWGWTFFSGHEFSVVSQRNLIFPTGVFIGTIGLIGIIGKIGYFINNHHTVTLLASCLILLAFLDLFRFHHKFTPFTDKNLFYPEIPVTRWLKDHPGRTFGLFDANLNLPFRIPTVEGYDPLVIGDYVRYTSVAETGELILPKRSSAVQLPKNGTGTMRILNDLGVKYVIQPTVHGAQPWELRLWEYPGQFDLVYADDEYEVYQNRFARSPIEPAGSMKETQKRLFQVGAGGTLIGLLLIGSGYFHYQRSMIHDL